MEEGSFPVSKTDWRASEMVGWINVLASQHGWDELSLIPGIHIVEGEN